MAEEEVYQGKVKKLTKDGKHFVFECSVVSEWYGVDARLDAEWAPEGLEVGDTVRFTVTETGLGAPVVSWAEKRQPKKAKRKVEEADAEDANEPAEGTDLYVGKVGNPTKDGTMYLIDCPVVTDWYKLSARISGELLFLAGAGTGDELLFSLDADETAPRVVWAALANSAEAKRRLKGELPEKKKQKIVVESAEVGVKRPDKKLSVEELQEQLHQERTAKLEAQLEAERTKAAAQRAELEQLKRGASGDVLAAALKAGLPAKDEDSDDSSDVPHPLEARDMKQTGAGKGKSKSKPPSKPQATVEGLLRFLEADHALAALALFGTELNGCQVKPELDPAILTQIRVKSVAAGTTPDALKTHFKEAGKILTCSVDGKEIGSADTRDLGRETRDKKGMPKGGKGGGAAKGFVKGGGTTVKGVKGSGAAGKGVKGAVKGVAKKGKR